MPGFRPQYYEDQFYYSFACILGTTIALLAARTALWNTVFIPFMRKRIPFTADQKAGLAPLSKKEAYTLEKSAKYAWHAIFYSILWIWNIQILLTNLDWAFSCEKWVDMPSWDAEETSFPNIKWFMWIQAAWYGHGLIESMMMDGGRGDFMMLLFHHLISMLLTWGCWYTGCHRTGVVVTFEQDISDIVLYCAKIYDKWTSDPTTGDALPGTEGKHVAGLSIVAAVWFATRICALSWIVRGNYMYSDLEPLLHQVLFVTLFLLLLLQVVWFHGVSKMLIDGLSKGTFRDHWHEGHKSGERADIDTEMERLASADPKVRRRV